MHTSYGARVHWTFPEDLDPTDSSDSDSEDSESDDDSDSDYEDDRRFTDPPSSDFGDDDTEDEGERRGEEPALTEFDEDPHKIEENPPNYRILWDKDGDASIQSSIKAVLSSWTGPRSRKSLLTTLVIVFKKKH